MVLISGSEAIEATWELVQSVISRFARVCAYDRAGFGASDLGPIPSTISDRAEQLGLLLENAGLKSPFVLVGMSYWRADQACVPVSLHRKSVRNGDG